MDDFGKNVAYQDDIILVLNSPEMKIVLFTNSVDPDEVAHNEPPHMELYCLLFIL